MNPYETLGVPKDADPVKINKAYRRKAAKLHPDRNPGDTTAVARFRDVADAYAVLNDPDRRARYDATGQTSTPPSLAHRAAGIWSQALDQSVGQAANDGTEAHANHFERMKEWIRHVLGEQRKQLKLAEKQKAAFKKLLGKFKKAEGENMLEQIVSVKCRDCDVQIANMKERIAEFEWALEHLADYDYAAPKRPAPNFGASTTMGSIRIEYGF